MSDFTTVCGVCHDPVWHGYYAPGQDLESDNPVYVGCPGRDTAEADMSAYRARMDEYAAMVAEDDCSVEEDSFRMYRGWDV